MSEYTGSFFSQRLSRYHSVSVPVQLKENAQAFYARAERGRSILVSLQTFVWNQRKEDARQ